MVKFRLGRGIARPRFRNDSMLKHNFRIAGAWGSKLVSVAGHRCDRCGMLYVTMNLTADPAGTIFALDAEGNRIDRERIESGECDAAM